jgi:hypothetical protein
MALDAPFFMDPLSATVALSVSTTSAKATIVSAAQLAQRVSTRQSGTGTLYLTVGDGR